MAGRTARARAHIPFPVWAAFALLACEYLALGVAFDAEPLGQRAGGWRVAGHLGWLTVLVVSAAMGAAVVVLAGDRRLRWLLTARRSDARTVPLLAAHAVSVGLLWWLSATIFAPEGPPAGPSAAWLALWGLAAAASALCAFAAAFPPGQFRTLIPGVWPALVGGGVIGVGAWIAGQSSALLWWPLGPWTLRAVDLALKAVLTDPVSDLSQALIGSERFQVVIAPVCSGYEGVGLMAVFVGAYLVLARRQLQFPAVLLLLPIGLAAAWLANVARLVLLVLLGTLVSEEIAAGGFHARAGWLLFSGLALGLVLLAQRLRVFAREPGEELLGHPTAAFVLPFLVLVATSMVTGLASKNLDLLYGVRLLTVVPLLAAFRRSYRDISWSWSWSAIGAGLVAAAVFIALAPRPDPQTAQAWQAERLTLPAWGQACWLILRVVGSVLLVPIAEELAFRGYLLRRLIAREFETVSPARFSLWALLGSSLAFGAIHVGWLGGAIAGLLFGITQIRGKSVGHAVLAHALSNAVVAVYVLGLGQWWLWM